MGDEPYSLADLAAEAELQLAGFTDLDASSCFPDCLRSATIAP
jgi:hypothetical protein